MSHEILGNRFISRTQPAWHGLGTIFAADRTLSASEAVKDVAGDILVDARPLFYKDDAGTYVQADKYQAIVRSPLKDDPKEKLFGVTTERWMAVSYPKLAMALDELSKTYKVETCGLIQDGSLCFLALRGPDFSVKGDQMQDYFIVNLSNQPGNSHKVMAAPVRVVCFNTNMAANDSASINLAIPHGANAAQRINLAAKLVARFKEATQNLHDNFTAMAATQATQEGLDRILAAAFPLPNLPPELRLVQKMLSDSEQGALKEILGERFGAVVKAQADYDKGKERAVALRVAATQRFESFDPPQHKGTVWAAYNSVTEIADWREGRGAEVSSVWGSRAREKAAAFAEAMALVTN